MKFSEMTYTRPDIDALLARCKELTAKAAAADSGEALVEVYYEQSRAFADYNTAANLANIHYTCDTRDATYALPEQQEQAAQWGHSTFGQSAALAAKAGAKRLWLVHYSPMITDPEQQLAQAQSVFPAAECGFDGKRITLHYEENEE